MKDNHVSRRFRRANDLLLVSVFLLMLAGVFFGYILKAPTEVSRSERRHLLQFPEVTGRSVLSGTFFDAFESYTDDQFVMRESARRLKALFRYGVLLKKENHGIYLLGDSLIKREDRYKQEILYKNLEAWNRISQDVLEGASFYYALIPDKNYYGDAPKLDYLAFDEAVSKTLAPNFKKISYLPKIEDYYRTDLHLRQEAVYPFARSIADATGAKIDESEHYTLGDIGEFYGAYAGQSALTTTPDRLIIAESDVTRSAEVTVFAGEKSTKVPVYDLRRLDDVDRYSIYLGGPEAAIKVVNLRSGDGSASRSLSEIPSETSSDTPSNTPSKKTLVIFRDSFASAIVPYLISGYETIYLIDLRYMNSAAISALGIGEADDVLFLYSYTSLGNLLMK